MKLQLLPPLFKLCNKSTFFSSLNQNTCPVLDAEEIKNKNRKKLLISYIHKISTEINTLEDLSDLTVSDASGATLADADIFSDADLQLDYENSSYTNAKSVYESFNSVGTGLGDSPYDTLSL